MLIGYQSMDTENEMKIAQQSYDKSWKDSVELTEDDNTMSMGNHLQIYVMMQHMGDNQVANVDNQVVNAENQFNKYSDSQMI